MLPIVGDVYQEKGLGLNCMYLHQYLKFKFINRPII